MPGTARFGATIPTIVGAYLDQTPQHRDLVKHAYLAVTTNGSGVATVNFNARLVLNAVATATAGGNAVLGTAAVTVIADFY